MSREVASGSTVHPSAAPAAGAAVASRELPGAVLFACTTNAVRSVMAAAILRHLAGKRAYVASAGVRAGTSDPFVTAVMDEIGIDVSQHTPNTLPTCTTPRSISSSRCRRRHTTRRWS